MKKLVKMVLAPNASGVLFNLEEDGSGEKEMRISSDGAASIIKDIIQKRSYSELMKGNEVELYIICATKKEYEDYKKQGRID